MSRCLTVAMPSKSAWLFVNINFNYGAFCFTEDFTIKRKYFFLWKSISGKIINFHLLGNLGNVISLLLKGKSFSSNLNFLFSTYEKCFFMNQLFFSIILMPKSRRTVFFQINRPLYLELFFFLYVINHLSYSFLLAICILTIHIRSLCILCVYIEMEKIRRRAG